MPLKNISVDVQALEGHWQEVAFKLGDKVCTLWRLAFFHPGPGQKQASKNPVCLSAHRLQCPFWAVPVGMPGQQPLLWLVYRCCPVWPKPISNQLVTMQNEPDTAVFSQSLWSLAPTCILKPCELGAKLVFYQNNTLNKQTNKQTQTVIIILSANLFQQNPHFSAKSHLFLL